MTGRRRGRHREEGDGKRGRSIEKKERDIGKKGRDIEKGSVVDKNGRYVERE